MSDTPRADAEAGKRYGPDGMIKTCNLVSTEFGNRETGEERKLLDNATYGRYVDSGHVVWAWEGNLYAAPFDLDKLEVTGGPVKVQDGVLTETFRGTATSASPGTAPSPTCRAGCRPTLRASRW